MDVWFITALVVGGLAGAVFGQVASEYIFWWIYLGCERYRRWKERGR